MFERMANLVSSPVKGKILSHISNCFDVPPFYPGWILIWKLFLDACIPPQEAGVNGIVGVGGGSSMDAAKVAAFMCGDTK